MSYKIILDKLAEKFIKKQSKDIQARIITTVKKLVNDPFPTGVKKMKGM